MSCVLQIHHLLLLTLINLLFFNGYSVVIYEEGYTVTTVFDGNKLKINPRSVYPRPKSHDLLLLDSTKSVFYTLSLPLSQESLVQRFYGNENGKSEYSDGDASLATFNKPRSFTVDMKGNVYVADRFNHAIRKIGSSGATTIAGGFSKSPGRDDGPGRNATFSDDYEITFVPDMCALLVMDHGSQLIRQINLKQNDCVSSRSGGVGSTTTWVAALAVASLVGMLVGFITHPYIIRTEELKLLSRSKSWNFYLMIPGRQTWMRCFANKSVVASPTIRFLRQLIMPFFHHLSLIFRFCLKKDDSRSSGVRKEYVSLLDSDDTSTSEYCAISQKYADQLKELMTSNGDLGSYNRFNAISKHEDVLETDEHSRGQIDTLIRGNMQKFVEDAGKSTVLEETFVGVSTVVKRR
ncbi:uncharacterized protein LOC130820404 isoform X1 [Amaranthus tricolor]|uniref:uncharacterized protein LOC130820404 isoform X1 n=1 Tax=Amaranthus tricolor TaxID=29722 RepID=UPI00258C4200|nr:uncharacterized protein LOC130820404 isoform X1 [Amaranthus tricolor]